MWYDLAAGFEGVLHEEGDGHGADAAWDGGDGAAFGGDFVEGDVTHQFVAFFGAGGFNAVDADVDDNGAFLDVFGFEEFGAADGGDDDIGLAGDGAEVAGAGVGDGDGGVASGAFGHEEKCHGFANDHAATDDDRVSAAGFDAGVDEKALAAEGGAGDETCGVFEGEFGDVHWVEAVDVFGGINGADDFGFVDVLGWGALDKDAVDGGIGVELFDECDQFRLGGRGGEFVFDTVEAEVAAFFVLGADVGT